MAGPTGVGKSELAAQFAESIRGEIIGADAFQIYKGLPILTAQPPPAVLDRIPHHLVGCIPVSESFDVSRYHRLASAHIAEILGRGRQPIVVGGTGLYIKALINGLAPTPPPRPGSSRRARIHPS